MDDERERVAERDVPGATPDDETTTNFHRAPEIPASQPPVSGSPYSNRPRSVPPPRPSGPPSKPPPEPRARANTRELRAALTVKPTLWHGRETTRDPASLQTTTAEIDRVFSTASPRQRRWELARWAAYWIVGATVLLTIAWLLLR